MSSGECRAQAHRNPSGPLRLEGRSRVLFGTLGRGVGGEPLVADVIASLQPPIPNECGECPG